MIKLQNQHHSKIQSEEITYVSVATKLAELENKFPLLCNANKSKQIDSKNEDTFIKQSTTSPRRRSDHQ